MLSILKGLHHKPCKAFRNGSDIHLIPFAILLKGIRMNIFMLHVWRFWRENEKIVVCGPRCIRFYLYFQLGPYRAVCWAS